MHYYDIFIYVFICIMLVLTESMVHKHNGGVTKRIFPAVICFACVGIIVWNTQVSKNLKEYERMVQATSIIIKTDSMEKKIPFEYDSSVELLHQRNVPCYAKTEDLTEVCTLKFMSDTGNMSKNVRLCKLSELSKYPQYMYFVYEGQGYCLASDQILYKNALYELDAKFMISVLDAVLSVEL